MKLSPSRIIFTTAAALFATVVAAQQQPPPQYTEAQMVKIEESCASSPGPKAYWANITDKSDKVLAKVSFSTVGCAPVNAIARAEDSRNGYGAYIDLFPFKGDQVKVHILVNHALEKLMTPEELKEYSAQSNEMIYAPDGINAVVHVKPGSSTLILVGPYKVVLARTL